MLKCQQHSDDVPLHRFLKPELTNHRQLRRVMGCSRGIIVHRQRDEPETQQVERRPSQIVSANSRVTASLVIRPAQTQRFGAKIT